MKSAICFCFSSCKFGPFFFKVDFKDHFPFPLEDAKQEADGTVLTCLWEGVFLQVFSRIAEGMQKKPSFGDEQFWHKYQETTLPSLK